MTDRFEHILLQDDWTQAEREELERACVADPSLAASIRRWATVSRHVRESFRSEWSDSSLLVLYALSRSDFADALSPEERRRSASVAERIAASPSGDAIETILSRIRGDADLFEEAWADAFEPARASAPAADRAPIRPEPGVLRRVLAPRPALRWAYGLAAVLALTVAVFVLLRTQDTSPEIWSYTALPGQTHVIDLPDGSSVRLVDGAVLSHAVGPNEFDRHVALEGRAYFDVQKAERQFVIETGNARIAVLGTRFGVDADTGNRITEVVLVSGSVRLESTGAAASVDLTPGQLSRVVGDDAPDEPYEADLRRALAWADLFIFRETGLADAADQLSSGFGIPITVDESIASRTVTGTFARDQGLDAILDALATALSVNISSDENGGGYRISP